MLRIEHLLIPLVVFITAVVYTALGLYAWRRRPALAIVPFVGVLLASAWWLFASSFELYSLSENAKLFWFRAEIPGMVAAPVFWLMFVVEYTGRREFLARWIRLLLWLVPLQTIVVTMVPALRHLYWPGMDVETIGVVSRVIFTTGPFYWVQIWYSYSLVMVGCALIALEIARSPGLYRSQLILILVSVLLPWLASLAGIFWLNGLGVPDLTPAAFLLTVLFLLWGIGHLELLEITPLSHTAILRSLNDGVIVADARRHVLYLNETVQKMFGLSAARLIGCSLDDVFRQCGLAPLPQLGDREFHREIKVKVSGAERDFDLLVSPVTPEYNWQQASHYLLVFHDMTIRKQAERALDRRDTILKAVSLTAETFLKSTAWEQNIPMVLTKLGEAAGVSRVYVFENHYGEEGILFTTQTHEWVAPGIEPQIDNKLLRDMALAELGFERWETALSRGESISGLVHNFPESERELLQAQDIRSIAVVPIFVQERWWGFIGFDECCQEREWSAIELDAMRVAADIFGAAEARARTELALRRRQRTLNLLREIVQSALQAADQAAMAQALVDRLGDLIGAHGCFLALWDDTLHRAVPMAAYGPFKVMYSRLETLPGEKTFTESVLEAGHTLVIEDTMNTPYVSRRIAEIFSARSALVLPLLAGQQRLGSIILSFNILHRFSTEEIDISEQAANLISLTLVKVRSAEEARRRAEESETLRRAGAFIAATLQPDEAVTRVLEQLQRVVPYDSASVQLLRDGTDLEIVGGRGWADPNAVLGMKFSLENDNPNREVVRTRKPLVLTDAAERYPNFRKPPHDHIRSWLGVPLIVRDELFGLLAIDRSRPGQFDQDDVELAMAFADQVAIALENARLFTEIQNLALVDSLTGLYNRRGLFELGRIEFIRARRTGRSLSLLMIDIDHFKRINDHFGHDVGDQALQEVALLCNGVSREVDLVGRYGGEELVIILPETDLEGGKKLAERLRESVARTPLSTEQGPLKMTVSIGVAAFDPNVPDLETLIARADQAMYIAKHKGRNRVAASH
jgi:diguanylate cyclase (GGDEF)-like protein/PAS domain S-box-containing protein